MIEVTVDQDVVKNIIKGEIEKQLNKADFDMVLWDKHELARRTCMSWSTIQKTFFYHPDCPKVKVGGKWYFKAEEMKEFLLRWVDEQQKV